MSPSGSLIIQDQFYTIQNCPRSPIPQTSNWSGTFFCCFLQQTGSDKITYWLGRYSFLLGFIMSKNMRGCVLNFWLEYKITNLSNETWSIELISQLHITFWCSAAKKGFHTQLFKIWGLPNVENPQKIHFKLQKGHFLGLL